MRIRHRRDLRGYADHTRAARRAGSLLHSRPPSMLVLHDPLRQTDLPRGCIATIGNFDGMHVGHQAIVRGVVERSSPFIHTRWPSSRPTACPSRS
jgi:hypothetical protein